MLSRKTNTRSIGASVVLIGITVSGVFYAAGMKTFLHVEHAENGAVCKDCHEIDKTTFKMKNKNAGCVDCHEEAMVGVTLGGKSSQPPLRFSHEIHAAAFECNDCHVQTTSDKHKKGAPLVSAKRCNSCHKESGIEIKSEECKKCHGSDARKIAPKDHDRIWIRKHGRRSPWGSKSHRVRPCRFCHTKTECVTCHRTTKPRNHTGLWRIRTHGTAASFDRDRCKTCHETGSCVFCHKRTAPMSHRGPWRATHGLTAGSRTSGRCTVCHSIAQCTACHIGGQ